MSTGKAEQQKVMRKLSSKMQNGIGSKVRPTKVQSRRTTDKAMQMSWSRCVRLNWKMAIENAGMCLPFAIRHGYMQMGGGYFK